MNELSILQGEAALQCYPLEDAPVKGSVVICPGGGYSWLSPRESEPVARAFNAAGFHAFVLRYEVTDAPLEYRPVRQLGAAVAALRRDAAALGLDLGKIAVCGFSAGGHLAASLGVMWHRAECFAPGTALAEQRPDALVLCYPVITAGEYAHAGSLQNLAGLNPTEHDRFSLEKLVDEQTPPTFLWHTAEDESVPVQNTLLFAGELLRHRRSLELHIYPHGAHGLSLATEEVSDPENGRVPDTHVQSWFHLATEWLEAELKA